MPESTEQDWRRQSHEDLGILNARVSQTEQSIGAVGTRLDQLARDTTAQFATVSRTIGEVAKELSSKIDGALASRSTNWTGFWATVGTIAGVVATIIIGFGAAVITPITSNISATAAHLDKLADNAISKDEYYRDRKEASEWSISLRDRLRVDEDGAVSQRQMAELKDRFDERYRITSANDAQRFSRLETRLDEIDGELVKRPEIEAADRTVNSRVDAISSRLNALTDQLNGLFPASEVIKELWSSLREIRNGKVGEAEK